MRQSSRYLLRLQPATRAADQPASPAIAEHAAPQKVYRPRIQLHARLERSIWSKHDAPDPASKTGCGGNPMLQRALPVQQANIALGETPKAYEPPQARTLVRAVIGQVQRFCRWLGRLAEAGGPLS
jgi:hypothetical protein